MRPYLERSMATAGEMQKTLTEHAQKSAALNKEYADRALGHLSELLKIGSEAMRANADQAQQMAQKMAEQARRTYETTSEATEGTKKAP
jgi:polyhydroxyalkanoate synthesis regulator protein